MPSSSKPIRVAVVGAGTFGNVHLKTYSQLAQEGRVEIVGVADKSRDARSAAEQEFGVRSYADHQSLLAAGKPEAVSVVTPDHTHREIVCDALHAGCHVLVEKPMDTTVEGCREMVAAAERNHVLLQVDFHKRFDPYHAALRETVAEGKLGRPLYGYAWMENRISVPLEMLSAWAAQSSPGWFLGSHMTDLFRWIVGRPRALCVFATGQKGRLLGLGVDSYDAIQAHIVFERDMTLSLNVSWVLPDGFEAAVNQGIRIVGTEGIAEIDSQNRGAEVCTKEDGPATWNLGYRQDTKDKWGRPRHRGYGYESIADLVGNIEYLRGGGSLEALKGEYPDGEDGLEVTRILVAVHESITTGDRVIPG